jgi:hypothetical protein
MAIHEKGKWRDLGMVLKQSLKCLKNEKINFGLSILKLECLFYQNIFISFHHILFIYRDFVSNRKKVVQLFKKYAN